MKSNNTTNINQIRIFMTLLIVIFLALSFMPMPTAAGYDSAPTSTISASDDSVENTVTLTAAAVDVLDNAGIQKIELYEILPGEGLRLPLKIAEKNCNNQKTCTFVKVVYHGTKGTRQYSALAIDKAGQRKASEWVDVYFEGENYPPEITKRVPLSSNVNAEEHETVHFEITANDPDGDDLSYQWYSNDEAITGATTDSLDKPIDLVWLALHSNPSAESGVVPGVITQGLVVNQPPVGFDRPDLELHDSVYPDAPEFEEVDPFGSVGAALEDGETKEEEIKVVVRDSEGRTAEAVWDLTWHDTAPVAAFDFSPADPTEGEDVQFTDESTFVYDEIIAWSWDFDDGSTSNLQNPTHAFQANGNYDVELTVTDEDGSETSVTRTVAVGDDPITNLQLTADPNPVAELSSTELTCQVTGGNAPYTYTIYNYDDNELDVLTTQSASHSIDADTPAVDDEDVYTYTCVVQDRDGDQEETTVDVRVQTDAPEVTLNAVPTTGTEPVQVAFSCSVTGGNGPYEYTIDFDDSNQNNPDFSNPTNDRIAYYDGTYEDEGSYEPTCTVRDNDGDETESDPADLNLEDSVPVADFDARESTLVEHELVHFDADITAYDGIASTQWIVDGNAQTAQGHSGEPSLQITLPWTFTEDRDYEISLVVTDGDGSDIQVDHTFTVVANEPTVTFTVDDAQGPEVHEPEFTCEMVDGNLPATMQFDDGNGNIENVAITADNERVQTFDASYRLEGQYTAICDVSDVDLDTAQGTVDIDVLNNAPEPSLEANVSWTGNEEPLSVEFTCNVNNGNAPFDYIINFGDGSQAREDNVAEDSFSASKDYDQDGDYDVECIVMDDDGDQDTTQETLEVTDTAPDVLMTCTPDSPQLEGTDVNCIATVTAYDNVAGWELDFDSDGIPEYSDSGLDLPQVDIDEIFTFALEGTYVIELTAFDTEGTPTIFLYDAYEIQNNPPVAEIEFGAIEESENFESLDAEISCVTTGGNAPFDYEIDFGDGSTDSENGYADTFFEFTHTYVQNGTYDVECTITDVDDDSDTDTRPLIVPDSKPYGTVTWPVGPHTEGGDYDNVTFTLDIFELNKEFSNYDGVTDYSIDFGDGDVVAGIFDPAEQTISLDIEKHYTYNGTYNIVLTLTDLDGSVEVFDQGTIDIANNPLQNTNMWLSNNVEYEDTLVTAACQLATSANDYPVQVDVDFGDGNTDTGTLTSQGTLSFDNTYDIPGDYNVTCDFTDNDGDVDQEREALQVLHVNPTALFNYTPVAPREGEEVQFNDLSVANADALVSWAWDFGDGNTSTEQNPTNMFVTDGDYNISLTIVDEDGSTNTYAELVTVADSVPVPEFTWDPLNPNASQMVRFSDLSTAYDGIVDWDWDFDNDGVFEGSFQNMTTVFPLDGAYNVTLRVEDSDGSVEQVTRTVLVGEALNPPSIWNVQSTIINSTTVEFTWLTNKLADSQVDYGTTPALGTSTGNSTMVSDHSMTISGFLEDTLYYFNVTSCDDLAQCTTEGVFNFTTPDTTAPGPVTGLGETDVGENFITWSWTNPADADYDHAEVWIDGFFQDNVSSTENTYNATGLSALTQYEIQVYTVDDGGNMNPTPTTDLATTTDDLTAPVITNVTSILITNESARITWLTDDASNSTVEYGTTLALGDGTVEDVNFLSDHTIDLTGLQDETLYYFNVTSCNSRDLCTTEGSFNFTTLDLTAPGLVTGLNETDVGSDYITWHWTNPADADFDHVEVWLDGVFQDNVSAPDNTFNVTGLSELTQYEIQLRTVDDDGNVNPTFVTDTATTSTTAFGVLIVADRTSGAAPLTVNFQATVFNGVAPFTYEWDFDNDGIVDSTSPNPVHAFTQGAYTVVLNVTDSNSDMVSDTEVIQAQNLIHDILVSQLTHSKASSTIYLYDQVDVTATVENHGNTGETGVVFDLEVDGIVVDTQTVDLISGEQRDLVFNWANASTENYHTLTVKAAPVTGEQDLSDNMLSTTVRVWSVDDIVSQDTRFILHFANVAYVPIQNNFADESFQDLMAELTASGVGTLAVTPPGVQPADLPASGLETLQWNTAGSNGLLTAIEGNNEVTFSEIVP